MQTQGHDVASIARRSAYSWELKTTGKTAHSSGVFGQNMGDGAIYEIARILSRFDQELKELGLTYNVGVFAGGTSVSYDASAATMTAMGKTNVVPAQAQAVGDLRTVTEEQYRRVREPYDPAHRGAGDLSFVAPYVASISREAG